MLYQSLLQQKGESIMSNYNKVTITEDTRTELHDKLSLTGAEVSINHLPAGASVPFVHAHKNNEEIYAILEGAGKAEIDGETVTLAAGDWLRISPAAKRRFFAAEDTGIRFLCIQVKEHSLGDYTKNDAIV
jgi:mannose-6-phosphate isomerase-like protein (cupin superfamily)